MTARGLLAFAALVLLALPLSAAQLTESFKRTGRAPSGGIQVQVLRLDVSGGITDTDAGIGGETGSISDGDWSTAVDCSGLTRLAVGFWEYGTGTAELHVWNCFDSFGFSAAGVEDPNSNPDPNDPDPLCVDLTIGGSPAGPPVTIIGTTAGVQFWAPPPFLLNKIVFEIRDCDGECDATAVLQCGN